jgi:hypothetical protein
MTYELIQRLPVEIVLIIQNLVVKLNAKPKLLLDDIIDYHVSREKIVNKYHNIWVVQLEEHPPEHYYYLLSDVYNSLNGNHYIYHLNTNIRLSRTLISERLNRVLDRNYTIISLKLLGQKPIKSEFNILWGLLTPSERCSFI